MYCIYMIYVYMLVELVSAQQFLSSYRTSLSYSTQNCSQLTAHNDRAIILFHITSRHNLTPIALLSAMGGRRGKTRGRGAGAPSKLPTVSSRQDLDRAIKDAAPGCLIVLEFTATWCSVCRKIEHFYEGLADHPNILSLSSAAERKVALYRVDVDELPDLTNFYGASALPLFVFLVDGKKVDSLVGAQQTALKKKLLKHASSSKK